MKKTKLSQAGDTIVEVMISVAVVGLAIGLAYGVANRSLRASRQAQERGEALKIVEGQIESIKSVAASDSTQGLFTKTVFCIDPTGDGQGDVIGHSAGFSYKEDIDDDDLSKYGDCSSGLYNIAIQKSNNDFIVTARWFSIGNKEKEELKTVYRLYQ